MPELQSDLGQPGPGAAAVVVLTRSAERNAPLRAALEAHGLRVLDLPCFRTERVADTGALSSALARSSEDDVLVLTSAAAAAAIAAVTPPALVRAPVAAIGAATAAAAARAGLRVTFVAARPDGATLAVELPLPRGEVVLIRSDRAAPDLPEILAKRGARVREVDGYRTVPGVTGDVAAVAAAIDRGAAVVVLASPSAVEGFVGAVSADRARRAAMVAIGPTTAAAITSRLGVESVAAGATDTASLVRAVLSAAKAEVPA